MEQKRNNHDVCSLTEGTVEDPFTRKVKALIKRLVQKQDFENVHNFYADSEFKQSNLLQYFTAIYATQPKFIFIGEAPGIHGCFHTGIPFTSERLLKRGGQVYNHLKGPQFATKGDKYERSAAFIWEGIDRMSKPPVLWNIFPLHPYEMINGQIKNREPSEKEKAWGKEILNEVLAFFPNIKIVTIGNHARDACKQLKISTEGHLVHPSRRVNQFREEFEAFLSIDQ